jgi:two-component system, NtrC family, sensor kinase
LHAVVKLALFSGILLGFSMLVSLWIGLRMVGKPIAQLIEKSREIGKGSFSNPVELPAHDEISELAEAINRMSSSLAEARKLLLEETQSRITAINHLRHMERLATLGKLASGLAHELGTPLNVISGRAGMIQSGTYAPEENVKFAEIISVQTNNMTRVVKRMLEFSRKEPPKKSRASLSKLYSRVLEVMAPLAKKQNVRFEKIVIHAEQPVYIDETQIEQVFTNIVVNAIQSMDDGGKISADLDVAAMENPECPAQGKREYLRLRIQDTGPGISQSVLEQIFDPFFTTKASGQGTGLGLTIAEGIVKEHDGWINVESRERKGACFTVHLPVEEEAP